MASADRAITATVNVFDCIKARIPLP